MAETISMPKLGFDMAEGLLVRWVKQVGENINKGDVLAELDTSELNTQLSAARTQLSKAKVDLERSRKAFDEGIGPKMEYDNAKFAVEQQQSSVEQLEVQLGNMTVRAPLSGIVTKKLAQTGALISSGTALYEIIDPATYVLNINAPEKGYLSRIKVGQKASVQLDSLDGPVNAKVRRINPAVDQASGTVKVTLDFEKAALPKLRNYAFARVNLILATHENALMVPKNAIVEENTRKYVYIVERPASDAETPAPSASDSGSVFVASRKEIQTGLEDSTNIEVLEGIADDNLVVTVGQQTLKSGAEVKLTSVQEELLAKSGLSADEALKAAKEEHDQSAVAPK